MEVWSAGCDGGRAVLPDRCHAVCTAAAGSREPCDTTRDFSGPGTSVVAHALHMFVHCTHVITGDYMTVLVYVPEVGGLGDSVRNGGRAN